MLPPPTHPLQDPAEQFRESISLWCGVVCSSSLVTLSCANVRVRRPKATLPEMHRKGKKKIPYWHHSTAKYIWPSISPAIWHSSARESETLRKRQVPRKFGVRVPFPQATELHFRNCCFPGLACVRWATATFTGCLRRILWCSLSAHRVLWAWLRLARVLPYREGGNHQCTNCT